MTTTLADVIPATSAQQLAGNATLETIAAAEAAGNTTLAAILAQLEASTVETVWTDDTGAYFIRLATSTAITWTTPTGAASSGPGAGAKPVGGTTIASDTTRWQATAAVAGSYAIGDYLGHINIVDPATDAVLGNFWVNTTSSTVLSAAPPSANIAPIAPLAANAATATAQATAIATLASILAAETTGNASLATIAAAEATGNASLVTIAAAEATGNATLATIASPNVAATSTPLTTTISDTSAHMLGPFTPQLSREIWLTLNATAAASGTAQLLRSTDGGTTKVGLTAGGTLIGSYTPSAVTGVIVNEIIGVETDAAATYYLSITLTAGTVVCRVAQ